MMNNRAKVLFGLFMVVFVSFAVLFMGCSSILQAGDNKSAIPTEELSSIYQRALSSSLNKAASEIKDPDIARFVQKLLQAYELNKASQNSSGDEKTGLASLLPDLKKIHRAALEFPLKEAGKQIEDKEIAEFYDDFTTGIGVDK